MTARITRLTLLLWLVLALGTGARVQAQAPSDDTFQVTSEVDACRLEIMANPDGSRGAGGIACVDPATGRQRTYQDPGSVLPSQPGTAEYGLVYASKGGINRTLRIWFSGFPWSRSYSCRVRLKGFPGAFRIQEPVWLDQAGNPLPDTQAIPDQAKVEILSLIVPTIRIYANSEPQEPAYSDE